MAEQLADHGRALTASDRRVGEGMAQGRAAAEFPIKSQALARPG